MVTEQLTLELDDVTECPSCSKKDVPVEQVHQMGSCYRCFLIEVGAINPEEEA